jgi:predicted cupin superfamily sugar epimerase
VYTLVGCTVGPGFDFADFCLLRDEPTAVAQMYDCDGSLELLL